MPSSSSSALLLHAAIGLLLVLQPASAGHCYGITSCSACVGNYGGAACAWCGSRCQMATDTCASGLVAQGATTECPGYVAPSYPGEPFFQDFSSELTHNPTQRNYGVSVTDVNQDGRFEFIVAGNGYANLVYSWNSNTNSFDEVAATYGLTDASSKAIGVAACDVDGDGREEIYVLNTEQYSGSTSTSDRLFSSTSSSTTFTDLFQLSQNQAAANYAAGRSCACVDRDGDGKFEVMVANYGLPMKLYQTTGTHTSATVTDIGVAVGIAKTTGGRALVSGPIVTNRMDIFANNEGWSGRRRRQLLSHRSNYLFENNCGDTTAAAGNGFTDIAASAGVADNFQTGRGTALFDENGDGLVDIVYGNWIMDSSSEHRLYVQSRAGGPAGQPTFTDIATAEMKVPSRVRTVIVADFDNDGYEEIFFNNIPGDNRLFRKGASDPGWTQVDIGDALETAGYGTGAAVLDADGDGLLELVVSHGESASQPLSLYRAKSAAARTNGWLRVFPKTRFGAPARGSIVTLTHSSGRTQLRVIDAGSGYLCQMEPVAHFGLGALSAAAAATGRLAVTVQWPDGVKKSFQLAPNQQHDVDYPAAGEQVTQLPCQRGQAAVPVTIPATGSATTPASPSGAAAAGTTPVAPASNGGAATAPTTSTTLATGADAASGSTATPEQTQAWQNTQSKVMPLSSANSMIFSSGSSLVLVFVVAVVVEFLVL